MLLAQPNDHFWVLRQVRWVSTFRGDRWGGGGILYSKRPITLQSTSTTLAKTPELKPPGGAGQTQPRCTRCWCWEPSGERRAWADASTNPAAYSNESSASLVSALKMIALLTPQNMVDEVHGCFSLARWRKLEKLSLSMRGEEVGNT